MIHKGEKFKFDCHCGSSHQSCQINRCLYDVDLIMIVFYAFSSMTIQGLVLKNGLHVDQCSTNEPSNQESTLWLVGLTYKAWWSSSPFRVYVSTSWNAYTESIIRKGARVGRSWFSKCGEHGQPQHWVTPAGHENFVASGEYHQVWRWGLGPCWWERYTCISLGWPELLHFLVNWLFLDIIVISGAAFNKGPSNLRIAKGSSDQCMSFAWRSRPSSTSARKQNDLQWQEARAANNSGSDWRVPVQQ